MSEKTISRFLYGNQFIKLEEKQNEISIISGIVHEERWIDVLSIPLITFEKNLKIFGNTSSESQKDGEFYRIVLNRIQKNEYSIMMKITPYSLKKDYQWMKFQINIEFTNEFHFEELIPEIRMILIPKLTNADQLTYINQPSRHTPPTDEWKSNDMPASFIWNPKSSVGTLFFVNFSEMKWMSSDTIERFSYYECGFQRNNFFGLLQRNPLRKRIKIPSNFNMNFEFLIKHLSLKEKPSKWDAIDLLATSCYDLIPGTVPFPKEGLTWRNHSKGCIGDLMKENLCWINPSNPLYHAYVMEESEYQRRKAFKSIRTFETMTLLDIIPPWMLYLKLFPNKDQETHLTKMFHSLKLFIDPDTKFLFNNIYFDEKEEIKIIKPSETSIGDSWYFFEPIIRYGWFIRLLQLDKKDEALEKLHFNVFESMVKNAQQFIAKHNQEVTAFYDPFTLKPFSTIEKENPKRWSALISCRGEVDIKWKKRAKNYACLGMHIYILMQAYYFFKDNSYLEEAERLSSKFMAFSPDELFWEPFELSYAVSGFTELYRVTRTKNYLSFAKNIIHNELRMFYWYEDNSMNWEGKRRICGLVMACVGIRYPAMKENLESIYPWTIFLKTAVENQYYDLIPIGLLKFFNLIRINSFYYFSNVLPKEIIYPPRRNSECPFIPFEDLEMLETPAHFSKSQEYVKKGTRTGVLGRECYGAGEVIWLFLLFEGFVFADNQDIMILNLDLFDFKGMKEFPLKKILFLIYNPLEKTIQTQLTIHPAVRRPFFYKTHLIEDARFVKDSGEITDKKSNLDIELNAQSVQVLEINY